jgi:hypothetical protein
MPEDARDKLDNWRDGTIAKPDSNETNHSFSWAFAGTFARMEVADSHTACWFVSRY